MEKRKIEIKKQTLYFLGIGIMVIALAYTLFGNASNADGIYSGNLLEEDPSRQMAGAPCHYMAGGFMGDCNIREVELEAFQFGWSEETITVKPGELVRIKATSNDVDHGITIPEIGFNLVIPAGKTVTGEFMAPEPGEYTFGCSVMCGDGHHNMQGKLVVTK